MENEIWRLIPEFPRHSVSSLGRVRGPNGLRKLTLNKKGYPQLNLTANKIKTSVRLNVLVCRIFHGERPSPAHQAAHWDGIRTNCTATNLRWATLKENREDMKRHGTWQAGENHACAKTTNLVARQIRQRYNAELVNNRAPMGWYKIIMKEFDVSYSMVHDIIENRRYTYDQARVV